MAGKTERFIVTPQPRLGELPYHHDAARVMEELGIPYTYMASSMVPEADMYFVLRYIKNVPTDFKPYVEPHKHEVSQLYALIGDLTYDVTLEGERREVTGPAAIFIPAGMVHAIHPLRGSGYIAIITRAGQYEVSAP